jgi:hypothetical protein
MTFLAIDFIGTFTFAGRRSGLKAKTQRNRKTLQEECGSVPLTALPQFDTVIAVSDTHLPRFGRVLPEPLAAALRGADRILHAGDITESFVLDLLEDEAPTDAVAGNNDPPELRARLGEAKVVEIGGLRIGLTHGHDGPGPTAERAWRDTSGWDCLFLANLTSNLAGD